jgi:hypothetical protein
VIARSLGARLAASVIAAGVLLTSVAGCTFISVQATYLPYDAADGIGADLGDLALRDVRAVLGPDGQALSLVFVAINTGTSSTSLTLSFETANGPATQTINVGSGKSVSVGRPDDDTEAIVLFPGEIVPGQNFEVYAQAGTADGVVLTVPVFDASNPAYVDLAPPAIER